MPPLRLLAAAALTLGLLPAAALSRPNGPSYLTRSDVIAQHGMAATSQPLATQAALDILKQGGSAVDAAIAANAVLGLVEPTGCGIGGDLFAQVWDAGTQKLYGLNASGRSPGSLTAEEFARRGLRRIPAHGPLSVSVPGAVDGWFELHRKFGKLSMAQNLAPAIRYAKEGFPVSEVIAGAWAAGVKGLSGFENFAATYTLGGKAPEKGDIFRNPGLARTLEAIASGGRDAFYKGDIARTIDAYLERQGGFLSYQDFASHTSQWVEPVSVDYRGFQVWQLPPNGQGLAVLQMLSVLEGFDVKAMGFGSAEYLHTLVEAKKLVFEDRARFYADPSFAQVPVEALLSKDYAARRRRLIDPARAGTAYSAGDPVLRSGDTIYLTVADEEGTMVSLIQSNFHGMGSGMTPDGLGFVLQDRGELFNLEDPSHPNAYAPGKRPFHTIIPGFVTRDGKPLMSFGVMGGDMQPQGQVQVLVNLIDFGMGLQQAGDAPRMYHSGSAEPTGQPAQPGGGTVFLEPGFAPGVAEALAGRGHQLGGSQAQFGGYQAIWKDAARGVYLGASESRKDGQASGY